MSGTHPNIGCANYVMCQIKLRHMHRFIAEDDLVYNVLRTAACDVDR